MAAAWPSAPALHFVQLRALLRKVECDERGDGSFDCFPPHCFEVRRTVAKWCQDVSRLLGFGERTAALATDVFDRYSSLAPPPPTLSGEPVARLIGFCSLVLASKMEEPRPLLPSQVASALGGLFCISEVCAAERAIAKALQFNFDAPLEEDILLALLPVLGARALGAPPAATAAAPPPPASACRFQHPYVPLPGNGVAAPALSMLACRAAALLQLARPDPAWLAHGPAAMAAGAALSASWEQWPPAAGGGGAAIVAARRQEAFLGRCAELGVGDARAVLACAAMVEAVVARHLEHSSASARLSRFTSGNYTCGGDGGGSPSGGSSFSECSSSPVAQVNAARRGVERILTDAAVVGDTLCACKRRGGRRSPNFVGDFCFDWNDAPSGTPTVQDGAVEGAGVCAICFGTGLVPMEAAATMPQAPPGFGGLQQQEQQLQAHERQRQEQQQPLPPPPPAFGPTPLWAAAPSPPGLHRQRPVFEPQAVTALQQPPQPRRFSWPSRPKGPSPYFGAGAGAETPVPATYEGHGSISAPRSQPFTPAPPQNTPAGAAWSGIAPTGTGSASSSMMTSVPKRPTVGQPFLGVGLSHASKKIRADEVV